MRSLVVIGVALVALLAGAAGAGGSTAAATQHSIVVTGNGSVATGDVFRVAERRKKVKPLPMADRTTETQPVLKGCVSVAGTSKECVGPRACPRTRGYARPGL